MFPPRSQDLARRSAAVLGVVLVAALLAGFAHVLTADHAHAGLCPVCTWSHGFLGIAVLSGIVLARRMASRLTPPLSAVCPVRPRLSGRSPPSA